MKNNSNFNHNKLFFLTKFVLKKGIDLKMKEQQYILKNPETFELRDIFECGQCFRWNEQKDGSYTGIWKENVVNVKKEGKDYVFSGICKNGNLEEEIYIHILI